MSHPSKRDYFKAIDPRDQKAPRAFKRTILDEFGRGGGYPRP